MKTELDKAQRADLKRYVLSNNLDKDLRHLTLLRYTACQNNQEKLIEESNKEIEEFKDNCGEDLFKAVESVNNSRYHRIKKVKEKITRVVSSGRGIFLTLTFNDKIIEMTSEETRRRYVARFLKKTCMFYVANQDFGEKKEREHYHAVVYSKHNNIPLKQWVYGSINAKRISVGEKNIGAISRYVSKLTNHAVKDSASMKRMIYSRMNDTFFDDCKKNQQRLNLKAFMQELKESSPEYQAEQNARAFRECF